MRIAFLTDNYMYDSDERPVLDPFRRGVVDGLALLGHQVRPYLINQNYLQERSTTPLEPGDDVRLAADITEQRPELILSINRAGFCPPVLELQGSRFASWYIDNVNTFPPDMLVFHPQEQVFFFGKRSAEEPAAAPTQLPMARRFFLPLGVDDRIFRPRTDVRKQVSARFNILFMGGFFSSTRLWRTARGRNPAFYRVIKQLLERIPILRSYPAYLALLSELGITDSSESEVRGLLHALLSSETGLNRVRMLEVVMDLGLTIYGGGWEAMIPEHLELLTCFSGHSVTDANLVASLMAVSQVAVNITHCQSRLCGGVNLRAYEAMSCGILLVNDHPDELGELFEEGGEFLGYRTPEELRLRCEWALNHPREAQQIAVAGHRAVLAGHTLGHRLKQLLETVAES